MIDMVHTLAYEASTGFQDGQLLVLLDSIYGLETWALIDLSTICRFRSPKGEAIGVFKPIPIFERLEDV